MKNCNVKTQKINICEILLFTILILPSTNIHQNTAKWNQNQICEMEQKWQQVGFLIHHDSSYQT